MADDAPMHHGAAAQTVHADETTDGPPTLARKIDFLFRTVHPAGRGEYTLKEAQDGMHALGYKVSDSALHQLRSGARTNPTHHTIEALCTFFGVPAGYFFDETNWAAVKQELELLAGLRDARVRSIATRAVGLSADNLTILSQVIDSMRSLNVKGDSRNPRSGH